MPSKSRADEVAALKQAIRESVWTRLEEGGIARFPKPVRGRIPNFAGAEKAAERLRTLKPYREAQTVKVNPDSPQRNVRLNVLRDGKLLVFPTPRISKGFLILDPEKIPENKYDVASSIEGAFRYGVRVAPRDLPEVEFIVCGSVAVSPDGWRVGKGEGYSEIEYAVLRSLGKVDNEVPVATTVHDIQVVGSIPHTVYDLPVDLIITNTRIINCPPNKKPEGIYWEHISAEKIEAIPLLRELRQSSSQKRP